MKGAPSGVRQSADEVGHFLLKLSVYYVYVLQLNNNTFYTGFSSDLVKRVKEHQARKVTRTKNLLPLELVFYAAFKTKLRALQFEKYLKTNSGFAFRSKHLI